MDRYVAELSLSLPVYMAPDDRWPRDQVGYYGCTRGYWGIDFEPDEHGTRRPIGIRLVLGLEATQTADAEDTALSAALRFGQLAAVYSGSPLPVPRLTRLARVGLSDGVLEQYNYYYLEGPAALPRILLRPYDLGRLSSWFARLGAADHYPLDLAARWYGMSVGAQDELDGYLSVWIGLESVGPVLSRQVHKAGVKAACGVCGNPSGAKRDKGEAGIQHAIKVVAPELLDCRSLEQLKEVRNRIAHGLQPAHALRGEAEQFLPDLQLSLIWGILTAARPETSAPGSGRAILPRNFKQYPDARAGVRSAVELVYHQPFFGTWLEVTRDFEDARSRLEADGRYIWGAKTGVGIRATVPEGAGEPEREYVIFERMGHRWENLDPDPTYLPIPVVPWRSRNVSPAWQRYLSSNEAKRES